MRTCSCSIGGLATVTGTAPNAIAVAQLELFDVKVSFLQYMIFGLPLTLCLLPVAIVALLPPLRHGSAAARSCTLLLRAATGQRAAAPHAPNFPRHAGRSAPGHLGAILPDRPRIADPKASVGQLAG